MSLLCYHIAPIRIQSLYRINTISYSISHWFLIWFTACIQYFFWMCQNFYYIIYYAHKFIRTYWLSISFADDVNLCVVSSSYCQAYQNKRIICVWFHIHIHAMYYYYSSFCKQNKTQNVRISSKNEPFNCHTITNIIHTKFYYILESNERKEVILFNDNMAHWKI